MLDGLTTRRREAEWIDAPDADPVLLHKSLRYIRRINALLGYTRATLHHLEAFSRSWEAGETIRIVDLATGSADIPRAIPPPETAQGNGSREALLQVEHLVKAYKFSGTEVVAVADVDLELNSGEVLGLVGESGSGKTSLAKSVVGLIQADGGEMKFHGTDIDAPAQKRPGREHAGASRR